MNMILGQWTVNMTLGKGPINRSCVCLIKLGEKKHASNVYRMDIYHHGNHQGCFLI